MSTGSNWSVKTGRPSVRWNRSGTISTGLRRGPSCFTPPSGGRSRGRPVFRSTIRCASAGRSISCAVGRGGITRRIRIRGRKPSSIRFSPIWSMQAKSAETSSRPKWRRTMSATIRCSSLTAIAVGGYSTPSPSSRFTAAAAVAAGSSRMPLAGLSMVPSRPLDSRSLQKRRMSRLELEKPTVPRSWAPSSSSSTGMRPTGRPVSKASEIIETLSAVT